MTVRLALASALALAALSCTTAPMPAAGADTVGIGEEARFGGVAVRALRLVEDSRCPDGVQCIQAGTVRLAIRLARGTGRPRDIVLRLGEPEPLGDGHILRLVAVCPGPGAPGTPPPPRAYRFHLTLGASNAAIPPDRPC